jgi:glycosyltransferase involved in cell wall biosynthesis
LAKQVDFWVVSPQRAGFNPQELELINQYGLASAFHLISADSDETLRDYYAGALALVYPSEYEGLGCLFLRLWLRHFGSNV